MRTTLTIGVRNRLCISRLGVQKVAIVLYEVFLCGIKCIVCGASCINSILALVVISYRIRDSVNQSNDCICYLLVGRNRRFRNEILQTVRQVGIKGDIEIIVYSVCVIRQVAERTISPKYSCMFYCIRRICIRQNQTVTYELVLRAIPLRECKYRYRMFINKRPEGFLFPVPRYTIIIITQYRPQILRIRISGIIAVIVLQELYLPLTCCFVLKIVHIASIIFSRVILRAVALITIIEDISISRWSRSRSRSRTTAGVEIPISV